MSIINNATLFVNRKPLYCLVTSLAVLGLTACSSVDTHSTEDTFTQLDSQTDVADYLCADEPLKVMFHGEEAQVLWRGKEYNLTQAVSASGSHYLGEHVSFWLKGKEAGLDIDDLAKVRCHLIRVES